MSNHRDLYRADKVYSHTPEFVGNCWLCKAPIRFGQAAYVRDHSATLRSGGAPARKVHKGKCLTRATAYIARFTPQLFGDVT